MSGNLDKTGSSEDNKAVELPQATPNFTTPQSSDSYVQLDPGHWPAEQAVAEEVGKVVGKAEDFASEAKQEAEKHVSEMEQAVEGSARKSVKPPIMDGTTKTQSSSMFSRIEQAVEVGIKEAEDAASGYVQTAEAEVKGALDKAESYASSFWPFYSSSDAKNSDD